MCLSLQHTFFYILIMIWFYRFMLWLGGWKVDKTLPPEIQKCIVVAAPHTTNWDYWYLIAAFGVLKQRMRVTIKKEWTRFPYGLITIPLGAIAIDRSPKTPDAPRPSLVEAMIQLFKNKKKLIIVVTPEGSRGKRDEWKTGFYHVAQGAGVPICLGYVDYKKKIAGIGKVIYLTDFEQDMRTIMAFYQNITPLYPKKFALDKRYAPEANN